MRWEKESQFIEIEKAWSVDTNSHVLIVSSSIPWVDLPIEFREQVPVADEVRLAALNEAVSEWAEHNSYVQAD